MWLMRKQLFNLNVKRRNILYVYTGNSGETPKNKILLLSASANPEVEAGVFANTHDQETSCWYFSFTHLGINLKKKKKMFWFQSL